MTERGGGSKSKKASRRDAPSCPYLRNLSLRASLHRSTDSSASAPQHDLHPVTLATTHTALYRTSSPTPTSRIFQHACTCQTSNFSHTPMPRRFAWMLCKHIQNKNTYIMQWPLSSSRHHRCRPGAWLFPWLEMLAIYRQHANMSPIFAPTFQFQRHVSLVLEHFCVVIFPTLVRYQEQTIYCT